MQCIAAAVRQMERIKESGPCQHARCAGTLACMGDSMTVSARFAGAGLLDLPAAPVLFHFDPEGFAA